MVMMMMLLQWQTAEIDVSTADILSPKATKTVSS